MSLKTPHIEVTLNTGPVEPGRWPPCPPGGAEVVFVGRTRPETDPTAGPLEALCYEAHATMAQRELEAIANEAAERWSCHAVRVQHAVGRVEPGQGSVTVEVIADHRAEAFEAARWIIDTLKQRVPIWKQCLWKDGSSWMEGTPVT